MKKCTFLSIYYSDLMVRMAHSSNSIEGNTLTEDDVSTILRNGRMPQNIKVREFYGIINYKHFMKRFIECIDSKRPIDNELIKEFHYLLCDKVIDTPLGEFKTRPTITTDTGFETSYSKKVEKAMKNWVCELDSMLKVAKGNKAIVEVICKQHIAFYQVAPFLNGNECVARALMVYICLLHNINPIVISVDEQSRYKSIIATENVSDFVDLCIGLQDVDHIRATTCLRIFNCINKKKSYI